MGISVKRGNYTELRKMVHDVHKDLVDAGFKLVLHRNVIEMEADSMVITPEVLEGDPDWQTTGLYIFEATPAVDYFPVNEPYNIVFMVHKKWWKIFVCTPEGLTYDPFNNTFSVESYTDEYWPEDDALVAGEQRWVGALSVDRKTSDTTPGQQFLNLDPENTSWSSLKGLEVDEDGVLELEPFPLSYRLTVAKHGLAFCTWVENMNDKGDCQAWFCIQRPKDSEGNIDALKGRHPIWCVYSQNGGGNPSDSEDTPAIDPSGIRQFVVRERDINLPSLSCSAVLPDGDHVPLINPAEQVSLQEDGSYQINIPSGLNSWRYVYPHLLDLIAFSSADVSAHGHYLTHDVFEDGNPLTYYAMKANRPENRGMRMFMQTSGPGTTPPAALPLRIYIKHINRGATESVTAPLTFVEIELMEIDSGTAYPAPHEIKIPFTIDPQSSAIEGVDYNLQTNDGHIVIPKGGTKGKLFGQIIQRAGDNGLRSALFIVTDNLGDVDQIYNPAFTIQDNVV